MHWAALSTSAFFHVLTLLSIQNKFNYSGTFTPLPRQDIRGLMWTSRKYKTFHCVVWRKFLGAELSVKMVYYWNWYKQNLSPLIWIADVRWNPFAFPRWALLLQSAGIIYVLILTFRFAVLKSMHVSTFGNSLWQCNILPPFFQCCFGCVALIALLKISHS